MNCKIAIAHGSIGARNYEPPKSDRNRAIRRNLAMLWLAQTFRDMRIIGLTRAEMADVTSATLHGWCGKIPTFDEASHNDAGCSRV